MSVLWEMNFVWYFENIYQWIFGFENQLFNLSWGIIYVTRILGKFVCMILCDTNPSYFIFNIKSFGFCLRLSNDNENEKKLDIIMYSNLTMRVILPVKYHQCMMNQCKLLEQGLHWIKILHHIFFPMYISNMLSEIYIMHIIFFLSYSYCRFFVNVYRT